MDSKDKMKIVRTNAVSEQLKGDTFPTSWDNFLDEDIRDFFNGLFEMTGQKKSDVIRKANIDRVYGYQIMDGTRLGKRDYYLRIAIAMSLDLTNTQRMLAVTHGGSLHPLIKRDAAVIFAINHKYDNGETDKFMTGVDLLPLDDGLGEFGNG